MKTKITTIITLIASLTFASAAEKTKTPNGGRVIDNVSPVAEFFVTKDRLVEIRFLDATGKVITPVVQGVTVITGDRMNPTKLTFVQDGDKLVSDKVIQVGKDVPVILQIKMTPDAKSINTKFNLNMAICSGCKLNEYACACNHEGGKNPSHVHTGGEAHVH